MIKTFAIVLSLVMSGLLTPLVHATSPSFDGAAQTNPGQIVEHGKKRTYIERKKKDMRQDMEQETHGGSVLEIKDGGVNTDDIAKPKK